MKLIYGINMLQAIQSNTSFSGLIAPNKVCLGWRRTSQGRTFPFYKKFYHPFSDETLDEIARTIKFLNKYENLKFTVSKKLSISKQDYAELISGKSNFPLSFAEKDCLTETKVIPERLYRLWLSA